MKPDARYPPVVPTTLRTPLLVFATLVLPASAAESAPKVPPIDKHTATIGLSSGKLSVQVAPDADKSDKAEKSDKSKESPVERARRGVVTIERGGEVLGLGTALKDDGRVVAALSSLGDGNGLDVRYADGSVSQAKVGHTDRVWDLALLVPQLGKWPEGLSASGADALKQGGHLRSFAPGKGKAQPAALVLKGRRSFLGGDDHLLRDVFEVGTRLSAKELGSPIVDDDGEVLGVIARACAPVEKGPCAPTPIGVPTDALKSFLRTVPATAVQPAPWLGIQGASDRVAGIPGVRVVSVSTEGPADEAGLKGGPDKSKSDLVVAVDDAPVTSPEALSRAVAAKGVGDRVRLLVFNGKFREVTAVLRPAPGR